MSEEIRKKDINTEVKKKSVKTERRNKKFRQDMFGLNIWKIY